MTAQLRIGLIGVGTVGQGVARLIETNRIQFKSVSGLNPVLACSLVRSPQNKDLSFLGEDCQVTETIDAFLACKPDVVLELIGGTTDARDFVEASLKAGIPVVTANKALLAECPEVFAVAKANKVSIGFEASCGGGIPVVAGLRDGVAANKVSKLLGILNGTCNYILTEIAQKGMAYDVALKDAQVKGFAEADPTFDVGGFDTAHKLAILASMAFGFPVDYKKIAVEGIDKIDTRDIVYAENLGYVAKLLAVGERCGNSVSLRVQPVLVGQTHPIAHVHGVNNAICVDGDYAGQLMFYGAGAGGDATASAVMADVLDVASAASKANFSRTINMMQAQPNTDYLSLAAVKARYYVRLDVKDVAGVMSKISSAFEANDISLASILQQETQAGDVPVVLITHDTNEAALNATLEQLVSLDILCAPAVTYHLES